jgi:hypothetical protein
MVRFNTMAGLSMEGYARQIVTVYLAPATVRHSFEFMAKPSDGAPAIPPEELCERLSHNCLDPRTTRALLQDPNFQQLQFRGE